MEVLQYQAWMRYFAQIFPDIREKSGLCKQARGHGVRAAKTFFECVGVDTALRFSGNHGRQGAGPAHVVLVHQGE